MKKKEKSGLSRLLEIAAGRKGLLFVAMALCTASIVGLFTPLLATYAVITELMSGDLASVDRALLWRWGWASLGGILAYGALQYFGLMASHIGAFGVIAETRVALGRKLTRLPLGELTDRSSGAIRKIITDDTERLETWLAHYIPDITSAVATLVVTLGYLFWVDWRLSLAALLPFALAFTMQSLMMGKENAVRLERYAKALEQMNSTVIEFVRAMEVIKIFNRNITAMGRYRRDIHGLRDAMSNWMREVINPYAGFLTIISSSLLFVLLTATLILSRGADFPALAPTIFLFMILSTALAIPLYKLMFTGGVLNQINEGVKRIDSILRTEELSLATERVAVAGHGVRFADVHFSYGSTEVLRGVNFTAKAGEITALVGPSGGGKSTIAHLLPRFWDVAAGAIEIGGVDVREFPPEQLMAMVSFVFQEQHLFAQTIEQNIRMGNEAAPMSAVIAAAKAAHLHEFILSLPQEYQTRIGDGGKYLSGGEIQRLALARAILKDAPIIVLDEATAYADPENEALILDSFSSLIAGKTVIVIAHRLSTIMDADQILVIDGGAVVERGTQEELLSLEGLYWQMWQRYTDAQQWELTKETK